MVYTSSDKQLWRTDLPYLIFENVILLQSRIFVVGVGAFLHKSTNINFLKKYTTKVLYTKCVCILILSILQTFFLSLILVE